MDKDTLIFGGSCGGGHSELDLSAGLGLEGGGLTGVQRALKVRGSHYKHIVEFAGEGRLFDMSFDDFSGCFARRQQVMFIVFDNQNYSSSGSHATNTTPVGARTNVKRQGVDVPGKNVPLMFIFNGAQHVATASPAYPRDYVKKIKNGFWRKPCLIHVLTPCITSWKYDPSETITLSRLAVQTGLHPLWEYKDGVFKRTVQVERRLPVEEYIKAQRRFTGVTNEQIEKLQAYADEMTAIVDKMEKGFSEG
ncbi:MAG: pyruvate synthase subunit beta [Chloroflexi bacterium]|nr:pyruvate synthase subunit beta [Chloroflexota bacterium]